MSAFDGANFGADPCTQIQVDLSAMLDGELDAASVRRVMVHSDVCPSCCAFLGGIRAQARSHRVLHQVLTGADGDTVTVPTSVVGGEVPTLAGGARVRVEALRKQLTENRVQLARVFYEIGRGFVLMGISPNFSRVVAREPVPIPDMCRRGRSLVDEVERLAGATGVDAEWVHAKEVFGDDFVRSAPENLEKGIGLLEEALMLAPEYDEAAIYLGHAFHVAGKRDRAESVFRTLLERSADPGTCAFARLHLGNVYLDSGRPDQAEPLFLELVASGEVSRRPQFGLIYFNLALASAMQGRFDDCRNWFSRLYAEMPHKRRMIADELKTRSDVFETLSSQPTVYNLFAHDFPCWFPKKEAC